MLDDQGIRISFLAGVGYLSLLWGLPNILSNVYWQLRCLFLWVVVLRYWVIGAQCLQIVWWPRVVIFLCWRTFQTLKMRILCFWNSSYHHDNSEEQTSTAPFQKPKSLHVCGDCFPWGMVQTIHLPFCVKHKNAWSYMPRESCVKCVSKRNYFQATSEEIVTLNGQFRSGFLMLLVPLLHVSV